MPHTATRLQRLTWTKKARAILNARDHARFAFRMELRGPTDGSGCLPPGEYPVHKTRWRSTEQKAVADAVTYCDAHEIKITEFPIGHGY
jgi:hypothetical protein